MDTPMDNTLSQHWVTVLDEQGHERLEARWYAPQTAAAAAFAA